jgi:hypothetical protein
MAKRITSRIWTLCCTVPGQQVHGILPVLASTAFGEGSQLVLVCNLDVLRAFLRALIQQQLASTGVERIIITATNLAEAREALQLARTDGAVQTARYMCI